MDESIILRTRNECVEVIESLRVVIMTHGYATVSDLNELLGLTGYYTDEKLGWVELKNVGVTQAEGGYSLDLPKPQQLH